MLEQTAAETDARYEDALRDDDLPGEPGDTEHSWLGLLRHDDVTSTRGPGGTTADPDPLDVFDVAPHDADSPQ